MNGKPNFMKKFKPQLKPERKKEDPAEEIVEDQYCKIPGFHPTNEWETMLIPLDKSLSDRDQPLGVVLKVELGLVDQVRKILQKHGFGDCCMERNSSTSANELEFLFDYRYYPKIAPLVEDALKPTRILRLPTVLYDIVKKQLDKEYIRPLTSEQLKARWDQMPGELVKVLLPYQKKGVEYLWQRVGGGMIADEMGLGKTIQAITYMMSASIVDGNQNPILIIAPKSAAGNWQHQLPLYDKSINRNDILILESSEMARQYLPVLIAYVGNKGLKRTYFLSDSDNDDNDHNDEKTKDDKEKDKKQPSKKRKDQYMDIEAKIAEAEGKPPPLKKRRKTKQERLEAQSKVYKVYFVTYGLVKNILDLLLKCKFEKLILDESQACKNLATLQAQACFELGSAPHCRYSCQLSGTPNSNTNDMLGQLRIRHPWMFLNHWKPYCPPYGGTPILFLSEARKFVPKHYDTEKGFNFGWRYCDPHPYTFTIRGGKRMHDFKLNGASRILEFGAIVNKFFVIRRTKKEVQDQLPPINRVMTYLLASEDKIAEHQYDMEQLSVYKKKSEQLYQQKMSELYNSKLYGLKLPLIKQYLLDLFRIGYMAENPNVKCIMFAFHKDLIKEIGLILDELHVPHFAMDGDTPTETRTKNVDRFRDEPVQTCRVAVMSFAFCSAINMEAAEQVFFFELCWQPEIILQAEARCHRLTTKKLVTSNFVLVQDSMEDKVMFPRLEDKQNTADMILNPKFLVDPNNAKLVGIPIHQRQTFVPTSSSSSSSLQE